MDKARGRYDQAVLKKGLFASLALFLALLLIGLLVREDWTCRAYVSDTVAHGELLGAAAPGDTICQGLSAPGVRIEEIRLDLAYLGEASQAAIEAELTDSAGRTLGSASAEIPAGFTGEAVVLAFGPSLPLPNGDVTLRLTLLGTQPPALWLGDLVDAGRFTVDAEGLNQLFVNGEARRGRLCMVVRGTLKSGIMRWYWLLCPVGAGLGVLYTLLCARRKAQGQTTAILHLVDNARRYSFLLEQLVARNFNTKYRQSLLGVLWSFLNPLLTMAVQYVVFSTIFRSSVENFPVYLITGIILFGFFTESVSLGMDAIVLNGPLITKVAMPKAIFPISRTLSSLINLVISLVPLLLLMLLTGAPFTPALLLLPLLLAFLFCFALGMVFLMATLNVFFRDTRFLWSVISLLWTYATPIFYPETILPSALRPLFHLNPMYQMIDFLRSITLQGTVPSPERFGLCLLCAALPLLAGYAVFHRHEDAFVFHL